MSEDVKPEGQEPSPEQPEVVKEDPKFVPRARLNEEIGKKKDLESQLAEVKQKADLLDKLQNNPNLVQQWADQLNPKSNSPSETLDDDLLDRGAVEKLIESKLNPYIQSFNQSVSPLVTKMERDELQKQYSFSDKQMNEADPFVREHMDKNPGMSYQTAFKDIYFDNFVNNTPIANTPSGETVDASTQSNEAEVGPTDVELRKAREEAIKKFGANSQEVKDFTRMLLENYQKRNK